MGATFKWLYKYIQRVVRATKGSFGSLRSGRAHKNETQIMAAFRQRRNPLPERNRDMDGLYICGPSRHIKPLTGTQYATFPG